MKIRIIKVISTVLVLIMLLLGYYFLNSQYNIGIPCIFHELTGYQCPGCGITRALFSLLQGDIKKAFSYNQLIFFLAPFIIAYFIYTNYIYILGKKQSKKAQTIITIISTILIIITIAYGIIRNIY